VFLNCQEYEGFLVSGYNQCATRTTGTNIYRWGLFAVMLGLFLRKAPPMAISFPSKQHHIAALYDACALILDTYKETDLFKVYSEEGLEDHIDFAATAREIMGLIAEGDIK